MPTGNGGKNVPAEKLRVRAEIWGTDMDRFVLRNPVIDIDGVLVDLAAFAPSAGCEPMSIAIELSSDPDASLRSNVGVSATAPTFTAIVPDVSVVLSPSVVVAVTFSEKSASLSAGGVIVRPASRKSAEYLSRPLDTGASGLLVPQIRTREDVENVVKWCRYQPLGERGMGLSRQHHIGQHCHFLEKLKSLAFPVSASDRCHQYSDHP